MANLRKRIEADLAITLEGDCSLPVILVDPDGHTIDETVDGRPLTGQVLYDTVRVSPDTGEDIIVNNPVVTLRRSSLSRVPAAGEAWLVKIPESPLDGAELIPFMFDPSRPTEGGKSIGYVKLFLRKAKQS